VTTIKESKKLIFILGALTAFGPISIDFYLPGFGDMANDLKVMPSQLQYTLTSFIFGLSLGQLIYGPLSDKWGRKGPLLFGIVLFSMTSFLIAFCSSLKALIILRFIQALGSCVGMVITRAIIRDHFHAKEVAKVFSLILLIMGVSPIFAPMLGSQLLQFFNWRVLFVCLGVYGVLAFLGTLFVVKESLKEPVAFKKSFLNYVDLFKDRQFMLASLITGTVMAAMFSYISSSSIVFMEIFQMSKNSYPLFFGLNAFGLIFASQVNVRLLNSYSINQILTGAINIFFINSLFLALVTAMNLNLYWFEFALFLVISCIGMILPNITAKALEFQKHRAGVASALMGGLQFLIGSLGTFISASFADYGVWSMVLSLMIFVTISFLLYTFGLKKYAASGISTSQL